ncbi:hypothetical protein COU54_02150 [Candidatus Pacearchaeota archaeon CG10_big_fil_rev_8_21_14_0_10_31_24]|nr:MAG: hypothetical protein COU54_02150 [Candidatus Pacearchaeota archaeon CG10_big_fil_rev_8_21_14_0_10_31_24]
MSLTNTTKFQIGKAGITEGVINSLNLALKTHRFIRINTLASTGRDKKSIIEIAESILSKINYSARYRIIGFTIILTKQKEKPATK